MTSLLLPVHLSFAGLWLGCILTEVILERALLGAGRTQERILASLHKRVDLAVEAPAFICVLMTGALMLARASGGEALLWTKIVPGSLAVAANAYCVRLVVARDAAATREDWHAFDRLDRSQHMCGALVLLAVIAAFVAGMFRFSAT